MTLAELITDLKAAGANENTIKLALNCYELGKAEALMHDQIKTGMSVTMGGKRIDPMSIYKEPEQSSIFCGVDFAEGVLSVSVLRRRPDDVAELLHLEQIAIAPPRKPLTFEQRMNMWSNALIPMTATHRDCYSKGIQDAEATHGIKGAA